MYKPNAGRRDIDGLRALAVFVVLMFHAGIAGFSGGYLGVDVFFVISGFLISGIILKELEEGHFSLPRFFERRARRILPLLLLVSIASFIVATALLLPEVYAKTSGSILAAVLQYANVFFAREKAYFDLSVDFEPMIHMWSLSIEWQFYLVFPLATLLAYRLGGIRGTTQLFIAAWVISFAMALLGAKSGAVGHYYHFTPRIWEFLTGALLHPIQRHRVLGAAIARHSQTICLAGFALLLGSLHRLSGQSTAPDLLTLAPVLGTAALIAGGNHGGLWSRALGFAPLVYLGQISYGLYLWHQPLLAYARFLKGDSALSASALMLCLAICTVLAAATHRWVEQPFRRQITVPTQRFMVGIVLSSITLSGIAAAGSKGWLDQARFSTYEESVIASAKRSNLRGQSCNPADCNLAGYGSNDVILVGDSNAYHFSIPMTEAMDRAGKKILNLTKGGCPPLQGMTRSDYTPARNDECMAHNAAVLKLLERPDAPHTVVISAAWAIYFNNSNIALRPAADSLSTEPERRQSYLRSVDKEIDLWAKTGKRIILALPLPVLGVEPILTRFDLHGAGPTFPLSDFTKPNTELYQVFNRPKRTVELFDPAMQFCSNVSGIQTCITRVNGKLLFADRQHVSDFGARYIFPALFEMIARQNIQQ